MILWIVGFANDRTRERREFRVGRFVRRYINRLSSFLDE
jgi:hypothetical protein